MRFHSSRVPLCAALLFAIAAARPHEQAAAPAAGPIDFTGVSRAIGKLPPLLAKQPLYGLFLFGAKRDARVWAVLDKSRVDAKTYDVLYLDVNANGDLTDAAERFDGKSEGGGSEPGSTFNIGRFVDPGMPAESPRVHTDFSITWQPAAVSYRMHWNGGPVTMGCYGPERETYARFNKDPKLAPILVPGHDLPFQFELWMSRDLARGTDNMFRVFVGNRGSVTGAFSTVDDKFLKPDEFVIATLLYKDQTGKERNVRYELRERC